MLRKGRLRTRRSHVRVVQGAPPTLRVDGLPFPTRFEFRLRCACLVPQLRRTGCAGRTSLRSRSPLKVVGRTTPSNRPLRELRRKSLEWASAVTPRHRPNPETSGLRSPIRGQVTVARNRPPQVAEKNRRHRRSECRRRDCERMRAFATCCGFSAASDW